ncbi:hypothetical protein L3Q82_002447 [Scortum barcoo]|uniref:Uncharacterized protein n=1 Tax=Scortum barcoo TaxID=214431 RepID=A0ACB8W1A7_9TELE|nr:hypothetical protein L3Q82_002447 [Scortum barcoo]
MPQIDGPKDVKYATTDFSVLKTKCPSEAAKKQESIETEYAEVKIQVKEERENPGEGEGEVLEEEEEAMIVEDEETKHCVPEEEEGKDEAVYSNVKDIMDQHGPGAELPWAVAAVSLIVNVICIICVIFL